MLKYLPNVLSLSRILFIFVITGIIFTTMRYKYTLCLVLFAMGSVTDYLDGHTARKYNLVSSFGALYDALCDKIMVIGMFVALISLGMYPRYFVFPILVVVSREFLISGLRMIAATKQIVLSAERSGKVKTATQMVSVCITLGSYSLRELGFNNSVCRTTELCGQTTFLASSVMALTSGMGYVLKNRHLFQEEQCGKGQ